MVKAGLEASIALHLEIGGQNENNESPDWGSDDLAGLEHDKPHFILQTLSLAISKAKVGGELHLRVLCIVLADKASSKPNNDHLPT
jgi:hypothetical protein